MTTGPAGAPLEIPGYRDFQVVGRGGFSTVFQAWDVSRNRPVAIKVLGLGLDDPVGRQVFERESAGAGSLSDHPNIITLYDSGFTADGRAFLVMELCSAGSLARHVATAGPLGVGDCLELGVKIAGALETAHRRRILHRDVKPENLLLSPYADVVLCDFGVATLADRSEATTLHAMTPTYAAPEVLDRGASSTSSDLYSLGATLYHLLAGRPAFGTVTDSGLYRYLEQVATAEPPPIGRDDVPEPVEEHIRVLMAKDPSSRPASAAAVGRHLVAIQSSLGLAQTRLVIGEERVVPDGPPADADRTPPGEETGPTVARPARASTPPPAAVDEAPAAGSDGPSLPVLIAAAVAVAVVVALVLVLIGR